jgi:hypothetical protein
MLSREFDADLSALKNDGLLWTGDLRLRAIQQTDSKSRWEGLLRLSAYSGRNLCVWTTLRATLNAPDLHKTEVRMWQTRGAASFDHGGITYRRGRFSLFLGRDELSWGAERQAGLLFSGSAPSYDMVKLGFKTRRLFFTAFHSRLRRGRQEEWDEAIRRFVSGHRLDVLLNPRLSFSVSEAVVYGGENRSFDLGYLNPLTVFYAEQWNSETNDNVLIAGDLAMLFPGIAEVRAEVMIDDFQYDFETEPHEFAAGLSVRALNPLHPRASMIGASYFHVRGQTYGHLAAWNRFMHEGEVMGYPGGPDGDMLRIWGTLALPDEVLWTLQYTFGRQGEGRASDPQAPSGSKVRFPSGVVVSRHALGIEVAWRYAYETLLRARLEWYREDNADHRSGETRDGIELSVATMLFLRRASVPAM